MPVGDSAFDDIRLENLNNTITLVDSLLSDLRDVARKAGAPEHSVGLAGKTAAEFMSRLKDDLSNK